MTNDLSSTTRSENSTDLPTELTLCRCATSNKLRGHYALGFDAAGELSVGVPCKYDIDPGDRFILPVKRTNVCKYTKMNPCVDI